MELIDSDLIVYDDEYYVYILRCCDDTLYVGMTNDLKPRLKMHNSGKGSKYTMIRLPVEYVYIESGYSRGDAMRREFKLKHAGRAKKLQLIADPEKNEIEKFKDMF
jgi:putative endonuclease